MLRGHIHFIIMDRHIEDAASIMERLLLGGPAFAKTLWLVQIPILFVG